MSIARGIIVLVLTGVACGATYTTTSCNEYTNTAGTSGTFASPYSGSIMGTYNTEQASAADGDIISIIAGASCVWDTYWSFSPTNSLTFQGAGAKSATNGGSSTTGTDQTVITTTTSDGSFLKMTTSSGKTYRITGIAFSDTGSTPTTNGAIEISGSSTSVRFDHNHLNSTVTGYRIVYITGSVQGVADHNAVDQYNVNNPFAIENGRGWQGDTANTGDKSWADDNHWGTSQFFFVEDNWFNQNGSTGNYANDCSTGGRQVIRHNTFTALGVIQQHEMSGDARGCREGEVYSNTFLNSSVASQVAGSRSGTLLVWGNTVQLTKSYMGPYIDRETGQNSIFVPNGYAMCGNGVSTSGFVGTVNTSGSPSNVVLTSGNSAWGTTINFPSTSPAAWPQQSNPHIYINGTSYTVSSITDTTHLTLTTATSPATQTGVTYYVPSVWDGNTDNTGYPCLDMPGRGKGDLLVGSFSTQNRVDNSTSTATWPNQIIDPIYVWGNTNTWPGDSLDAAVSLFPHETVYHDNQDYFQQMATYCNGPAHNACGEWYSACGTLSTGQTCAFRGSEGVGQGLLSARPANSACAPNPLSSTAPGVGYWATDTNTLYVCEGASLGTSSWVSYYTPYTYPHPLQGAGSAGPTSLSQGVVIQGGAVIQN